jgi:hypothetical protein
LRPGLGKVPVAALQALNAKPQLLQVYVGLRRKRARPTGKRRTTPSQNQKPRWLLAMPEHFGQDN